MSIDAVAGDVRVAAAAASRRRPCLPRLAAISQSLPGPRDQADFLSQRAPDIVYQGYLFGRPEPDTDWLARAALVGTASVEDEG